MIPLRLFFFCAVISSVFSAESRKDEFGQTNTSAQKAQANQEITIKSPVVVKVEPTEKTKAELSQEAADRHESISFNRETIRLNASYVKATWILVGIGIVTVVAYALQSVFLIKTFRQTKENTRSSLRAYVQIVPHSMFGITQVGKIASGPLKVYLRVENFGSTPAIKMRLNCGFFVAHNLPLGGSFNFPEFGPVRIEGLDVFPNSSVPDERKLKILVTQNWNPSAEEWKGVESGSRSIYIYGKGGYWDMFGKDEHPIEFCFALKRDDGFIGHLIQLDERPPFPVDGSLADVGNRIA